MAKTHRSVFIKEVKAAFPEFVPALNAEGGLLHLEMHAFSDFVRRWIAEHDKPKVVKAFQILDRHFLTGNAALVNAIAVSCLEHLDLSPENGESSWALAYLPSRLRGPYAALRPYHDT